MKLKQKNQEEVISQNFEAQIPEEEKPTMKERIKSKINKLKGKINKKMVMISGGVITVLILLILIATSSKRISVFKPPVLPSPSPALYEEISNPSIYATDSAILKIEEKLKEIEKGIDQTDLKETGLNPPVLDMEVNFEE